MSLATRLSDLRTKHRYSLQQVADAVGVSKAHIWELEKGRTDNPAMGLVQRLADLYKVSISYMVGEDMDAPDADADLQRMFRQAKELSDRERAILDEMMATLVKSRGSED